MVEDGHPHAAKAAPFESHIAKAMGISKIAIIVDIMLLLFIFAF